MVKVVLQDDWVSENTQKLYEKIADCNEDAALVRPLLVVDDSKSVERFDVIHVKDVPPEDLEVPEETFGFEVRQLENKKEGELTNKIVVENFGEVESELKKVRKLQ